MALATRIDTIFVPDPEEPRNALIADGREITDISGVRLNVRSFGEAN